MEATAVLTTDPTAPIRPRGLTHAQRMEALGERTGGIAHDFNNLLAVIINYAAFAVEDFADDDPRRPDLLAIQNAGEQAARLIRQLVSFSRSHEADGTVDANAVLEAMKGLLDRAVGGNVALDYKPGLDLWHAEGDRSEIEQILMNLVINARDSMPDGGIVNVSTTNARLRSDSRLGLPGGDYVCLSVRDTGCGMSREVSARIFEPFFTTKSWGHGSGLGLATIWAIVDGRNGAVDVESEVGKGSCFSVYLPATAAVGVGSHREVEAGSVAP